MNTRMKYLTVVLTAAVAGGGFYAYSQRGAVQIPGDLRDAVADGAFGELSGGVDAPDINLPEPELAAVDADPGRVKAVKSVFPGLGRAPADGGPLFGRVADRNAQTKETALRFGDEPPMEVLKRMFEAGTQPEREDLIGVFEGRLFLPSNNEAYKMHLVGKVGEKIPDGGPLFTDKKSLYLADFNENASRDEVCSLFKSGKELDPVRIEDGSAIIEYTEIVNGYSFPPSSMRVRMNSGYQICQYTSPSLVTYGYHFKKVQCLK